MTPDLGLFRVCVESVDIDAELEPDTDIRNRIPLRHGQGV